MEQRARGFRVDQTKDYVVLYNNKNDVGRWIHDEGSIILSAINCVHIINSLLSRISTLMAGLGRSRFSYVPLQNLHTMDLLILMKYRESDDCSAGLFNNM